LYLEAVRNPPKLNASLFLGPYTANLALVPSLTAGNQVEQPAAAAAATPDHHQRYEERPATPAMAFNRSVAVPEDAHEPTLIAGKGVFLPFEYLVSSSADVLARKRATGVQRALPPATTVLEELDKTLREDEPGNNLILKGV
jgi:hypothetical protein